MGNSNSRETAIDSLMHQCLMRLEGFVGPYRGPGQLQGIHRVLIRTLQVLKAFIGPPMLFYKRFKDQHPVLKASILKTNPLKLP